MQALTIPNGYFQLWNLYLLQQQVDYQEQPVFQPYLLELNHVLAAPMDSQSSYTFFDEIMCLTQTLRQCPQLCFEMARLIRPEHFGVLGYMASRSERIADALQHVMRFSRLVIDGAEAAPIQILQHGQFFELCWPLHDVKYIRIHELTMACMVHLARQIFSLQHLNLVRVSFAHEPQMAYYHYQKFYACEIEFRQPTYALVMHAESLTIKSSMSDPSLMQLLLKQAEDAIAAKPKIENLLKFIRLYIADYIVQHEDIPKLAQVAAEMQMSTRSLQRYLQQQGTSFKSVIESERMKMCDKWLVQGIPFFDLALRLGYSDQSALARAYKTSTGQTLLARKRQVHPENADKF